jgi:hypothetical protein
MKKKKDVQMWKIVLKFATRALNEIEISFPLCEEHYQLLIRQP